MHKNTCFQLFKLLRCHKYVKRVYTYVASVYKLLQLHICCSSPLSCIWSWVRALVSFYWVLLANSSLFAKNAGMCLNYLKTTLARSHKLHYLVKLYCGISFRVCCIRPRLKLAFMLLVKIKFHARRHEKAKSRYIWLRAYRSMKWISILHLTCLNTTQKALVHWCPVSHWSYIIDYYILRDIKVRMQTQGRIETVANVALATIRFFPL